MIRLRTLVIAAALFILPACADMRESLTRNNYLSTGRAPEGWVPKKSLCLDFARNGWQDHPPAKDGCWAPVPKVGADVDADMQATYLRACTARFPGDNKKIAACVKAPPPPEIVNH